MRSHRFTTLLAAATALAVSWLATPTPAHAQYPELSEAPKVKKTGKNDVAVIVAVENYAFLPSVPGARQSASDWKSYLRYGLGVGQVFTLYDQEAALGDMKSVAKRAAKAAKAGGTVWWIFIGHGAPSKDKNDGLMVGVDGQQNVDSLAARGLLQNELLGLLGQGKQANTVVIVDASFSGKSGDGKSLAPGSQPVMNPAVAKNTVILSAAKSDQIAGALPGEERPAFSYLLLGALRGWGDADGNGTVTATEAVDYTERMLLSVKGRLQTPESFGNGKLTLAANVSESDPGIADLLDRSGREKTVSRRPARVEGFDLGEIDAQILNVSSKPSGLAVYVNGMEVGQTPISREVPSGKYKVEVRGKCHERTSKNVVVKKGRDQSVELEPEEIQAGIEVRASDGDGNAFKATVSVDGEEIGTTPGRFEVSACAKKIVVERSGYQSYEAALSVTASKLSKVRAKLSKRAIRLKGYAKIPAGSFTMGSPTSEEGRFFDDEKQHKVTISDAFWLKKTEVTQGEWKALMGNNPSYFKSCGDDCPVERVSWYEAVEYLNRLSKKEGLEGCYETSGCSGTLGGACSSSENQGYYCEGDYQCSTVKFKGLSCEGYRLPTEAEWEYAARAGSDGARYGSLDGIAWQRGNSGKKTHSVAKKTANAWGLNDMIGNVWEWTGDWYGESYPSGSVTDPTGANTGAGRVFRGCSWNFSALNCRAAFRGGRAPRSRKNSLGFRPARSVSP